MRHEYVQVALLTTCLALSGSTSPNPTGEVDFINVDCTKAYDIGNLNDSGDDTADLEYAQKRAIPRPENTALLLRASSILTRACIKDAFIGSQLSKYGFQTSEFDFVIICTLKDCQIKQYISQPSYEV